MIPALIFLLLRRYRRTHSEKAERLSATLGKTSKIVLLCLHLMLVYYIALPQNTHIVYSIKRKGNEVGTMSVLQQSSNNKTWLRLESQITIRLLLSITAKALEEAVFENGILQSSSVYQKLNGNERVNKKTKLADSTYIVTNGSRSEILKNYPIQFNMVCLYHHEPLKIANVYSDKFQRLLPIQILGDHHYKIVFPDGNYNEYFYSNGLCSRVEVHHSLYRSSFELK
jgi:hypothetical protein